MKKELTAVITEKCQGAWHLIYWHTPGRSPSHAHRDLTSTCNLEVLVLRDAQGDPKTSPIKPHRQQIQMSTIFLPNLTVDLPCSPKVSSKVCPHLTTGLTDRAQTSFCWFNMVLCILELGQRESLYL